MNYQTDSYIISLIKTLIELLTPKITTQVISFFVVPTTHYVIATTWYVVAATQDVVTTTLYVVPMSYTR